MSGLIGYRSGNRGRCVGSCRKPYQLLNRTTGEVCGSGYLLSTKDLNTIDRIDDLREIDSLKIEGRMKEPAYVTNVVAKYRAALDGKAGAQDREDLKKTFNRTFTKGYLFYEDPGDLTNIQRPNNFGYAIGKITGSYRGMWEITLEQRLNQNDIIRIDHRGEDVNLSVVKLYDRAGNLINGAEDVCYVKIKEALATGDIVYKTKDYQYYRELEKDQEKEFRRFPLNLKIYAYPDAKLVIDAEGLGCQYLYESQDLLEAAMNNPTGREQVEKQMARLGDTVFTLGELEFEEYDAFIPARLLNQARREIVSGLYEQKLAAKARRTRMPEKKTPISFPQQKPYLTAVVSNGKQQEVCQALGIETVYFENIVRRNQATYGERTGELLIGGFGGLQYYRGRNPFVTDYSFNVVNAESCCPTN
jgi:putative protease